jgi:hypothetical protein
MNLYAHGFSPAQSFLLFSELPETMTKWWLIFILFGFLVVVGVTGV